MIWAVAVVLGVLALAGCGGGRTTQSTSCQSPKEQRALARIEADLVTLRAAARLPAPDTLKGGPALNRATDRFLLDVETAPIGNLQRNRLIDHAAALAVASCQQCFQALEAARPIVGIARGDSGCPAALERRRDRTV
jgi:hypothetical protein